jgi:adenosine deaminase CECR1
MTDEYYTAVTHFNHSWDEIVQLGHNSLKYSFVESEVKTKLMAEYQADIAKFEQKYLAEDWLEKLEDVTPVSSGYSEKNFGINV